MSKPFTDLRERVDRHSVRLETLEDGDRYPAKSREEDRLLRREIQNVARHTVNVRLGPLVANEVVSKLTTYTWSSSYSTGGEDLTALNLTTIVPNFQDAQAFPKDGYTFNYDSGNNKLLAYTSAGVEVAATSNLSASPGETTILVFGTRDSSLPMYVSGGSELLISATLFFASGVTASSADYWTFTLNARESGDQFGSTVGTTWATEKATVNANEGITLFSSSAGRELGAGETLALIHTASTDLTSSIDEAFVTLVFQRKVT